MLVQLRQPVAGRYRGWLELFRSMTGKEPGAIERTEAFLSALSGDRPWWANV